MAPNPQTTTDVTQGESINGYVLPPRFQQLRAQEHQLSQLEQTDEVQDASSPQPAMFHTRSSSIFSIFKSKQSTDNQRRVHERTTSFTQPVGNNLTAGVNKMSALGQPPPQSIQQQLPPQPPAPLRPQQQRLDSPLPPPPPPPPPPQQQQQQQAPAPQIHMNAPQQRPSPSPQQVPPKTAQPLVPTQQNVNSPPPQSNQLLHPEIRSVVQLHTAHARKIYFSGPLVRRVECLPDGSKPHKDEGWTDIWAQLGGTTLSVWDMREIQEASKQGKEVPPAYINVTDAFVQVLGSVTVPATATMTAKRYPNVLTLNSAGGNLYLFSCPSTAALISWAAALRLAAWEKTRLDEIYTAHLIRITLSARDVPTTLVRGRMEGWAKIRIAGQTDWKRLWLVVQEGSDEQPQNGAGPTTLVKKKKRMSSLFSSKDSASIHSLLPPKPVISMFASPKPKDRKRAALTVSSITQAFAVYPERPELISKSTLIKIEGTFGDEEMAQNLRTREGYIMFMPEVESSNGQPAEMLKWIVALQDSFELYGRPDAWIWDPRDPSSLMYGYPVGPQKETLFLEREVAEGIDPREDRTSLVRNELKLLLQQHMRPPVQVVQNKLSPQQTGDTPVLPPINGINTNGVLPPLPPAGVRQQNPPFGPQIPSSPGNKANTPSNDASREVSRPLTPITEKSHSLNHGRPTAETPTATSPAQVPQKNGLLPQQPSPVGQVQTYSQIQQGDPGPSSILGRPIIHSPPAEAPAKVEPAPSLPVSNITNSMSLPTTSTVSTMQSSVFSSQTSATSIPSLPTSNLSMSQQLEGKEPAYQGAPQPLVPKSSPSTSPGFTPSPPDFLANQTRLVQNAKLAKQAPLEIKTPKPVSNLGASIAKTWNQPLPLSKPVTENAPTPPASTTKSWNQPPASTSQLSSNPLDSPKDEASDLSFEAGVIYYIQQTEGSSSSQTQKIEPKPSVDSEEEISLPYVGASSQASVYSTSEISQPEPDRTVLPMPAVKPIGRLSPPRSGLGRKPSGAREQSTTRVYKPDNLSSLTVTEAEEGEDTKPPSIPEQMKPQTKMPMDFGADDVNSETLAAYLKLADSDGALPSEPTLTVPAVSRTEPVSAHSPSDGTENIPVVRVDVPGGTGEVLPYKSSFAPSTKAAERKAKAKEQKDAKLAAVHRPGRANGKRRSRVAGAWESSEEEEEEEDDEDEEELDSEQLLTNGKVTAPQSVSSHHTMPSPEVPGRGLQIQPVSGNFQSEMLLTPSQLRPSRNLPQIPPTRSPAEDAQPAARRIASENYADGLRRQYHDEGPQIKAQADAPLPGGPRRDVWSQVLDPGRPVGRPEHPARDTFVQLEPSETMTKAFTPHGLLSAGMQDKEDRSAKRQEELARGTGASLVNVPNKPPPPQTGLLGYVTAHERERKREGGLGAALTEREREKRLVEERQRRFDEQQRQQLDQMQQGMSMYGTPYGYNPMVNPMMMNMMPMMSGGGLAPMVTGGGMPPMNPMMSGFPGMMGGYSPQQMFAAQQAAQAYQQAMVAFSVAGSQVGNEGAPAGAPQVPNNMSSMNTGAAPGMGGINPLMAGTMPVFDPRFSMFGMPMMPMGMPPMGGQMPLNTQMTGMSSFDPRASPGAANSAPPAANDLGLQPPVQPLQFSSRTSSPAGRGSPRAPASREQSDRGRSRPTSPK